MLFLMCFAASRGNAQLVTECPQNIGFENGTLQNWDCYIGEISGTGERFPDAVRPPRVSLNFSGPIPGQHSIIGSALSVIELVSGQVIFPVTGMEQFSLKSI